MNRLSGLVLLCAVFSLGARADVMTVAGDAELSGTVDGLHVTANATLSGSGVTVGGAGILVDPGVTATFATPVTVSEGTAVVKAKDRNNGNVTVSNGFPIEVGAGGTASFEGVVSGSAPILVHGVGATHFKAANAFTGALYVTNGAFHAWNDLSFGSADGLTSFYVPSSMNSNESAKPASIQLHLHGIDTAEPFERLDGSGYGGAYFYGATNYLRGPVYSSSNNYRSKAGDNKTTYLVHRQLLQADELEHSGFESRLRLRSGKRLLVRAAVGRRLDVCRLCADQPGGDESGRSRFQERERRA